MYVILRKTIQQGPHEIPEDRLEVNSHIQPTKNRNFLLVVVVGGGVRLDWCTIKEHQSLSRSRVWGHISKAWKIVMKCPYQLSLAISWSSYTSTFGGLHDLTLLPMGPPMLGFTSFIAKASDVLMIYGIVRLGTSLRGPRQRIAYTSLQHR